MYIANNLFHSYINKCKKSYSIDFHTMYWWSNRRDSKGHSCSWRVQPRTPPSFPSTSGQRPRRWWCTLSAMGRSPSPWCASPPPGGSAGRRQRRHRGTGIAKSRTDGFFHPIALSLRSFDTTLFEISHSQTLAQLVMYTVGRFFWAQGTNII